MKVTEDSLQKHKKNSSGLLKKLIELLEKQTGGREKLRPELKMILNMLNSENLPLPLRLILLKTEDFVAQKLFKQFPNFNIETPFVYLPKEVI